MKRECAWCGQTIKKTMQCSSVLPENCYWVPAVREFGVKEAVRRSMGSLEAKSYKRDEVQSTATQGEGE